MMYDLDPLGKVVGLATPFLAGIIHGYCDTQKILLDHSELENILTFGPTFLSGSLGALTARKYLSWNSRRIDLGPAPTEGAVICGAIGATTTALGYGIGYLVGALQN